MWPRFYKEDYQVVAHYLGSLIALIGGFMFMPFLLALICREWESALDFFLSISLTFFLAAALRMAKIRPRGINRRQALMVTALVWIFASAVSAYPLWLSGHFGSYLDSVFDVVSGFTDTGVILVQDVDHMSYSMNLWRHVLQIIGGQGIVVIMLGLGTFAKFSGAGLLYEAEGRNDMIMHQLANTTRFIIAVTSVLVTTGIISATLAIMTTGMDPFKSLFHATCLTFAGFATGGFAPTSINVIYYHSFLVEVVLEIIMLTGIYSFAMYFMMLVYGPREFVKDIEVKTIAIWISACIIIIAATMARDPHFSHLDALIRRGVFTIISAATNTGFSTMYTSQLADVVGKGALFATLLAMSMGGATNSTSGGIKALRVALVFKAIVNDVKRALLPERAVSYPSYYHLGQHLLSSKEAKDAMTIFLLFIATYLFGGMIGVALGYDPLDALFESVSVASGAGLTSGVTAPTMPAILKVVYIIEMIIGRLEFLTLLATFAAIWVSGKQYVRERKQKAHGGKEAEARRSLAK